MKKLLFISEHLPFSYGGFRRILHELQLFATEFQVHFIRLKLDGGHDEHVLELPRGVRFTQINCTRMRFDALFLFYPIYMPQMQKMAWIKPQVQKYVDEHGIDVVVFNTPSVALALRDIVAPTKVVEMIDSPQLYYRTKMEHSPSLKNRVIHTINRLNMGNVLNEFEKKFDLFAYISEGDRNEDGLPAGKTVVSMEGRDAPFKSFSTAKRDVDVLLLGRWQHPPNRDGLNEVLPVLGEINGKVALIGQNINESIMFPSNVVPMGFVDDLSELLFRTKIVLVPVFYGSGLQNKVFDALRHGCKVITTPFTKGKLEASGFHSNSVVAGTDIAGATNKALREYWDEDAVEAYRSYWKWHRIDAERQAQYLDAVKRIEKRGG
jgi:hypothetical protein